MQSAIKENPEHLFVKIFAIKANEVNDNADFFSTLELKKSASTFIGVPIFCNHQNDDIEKARGKCVHAWFDDDRDGIYIIAMVDKIAYPKLARGIGETVITGTSMGASVTASCCSVCHWCSSDKDGYCDHVKHRRNKKFNGTTTCQYHESGTKIDGYGDKCPVCGIKKGETKDMLHKEALIFEHNFGVKFIEDSFVVNPASHDCLVEQILNMPVITKKVAYLKDVVTKISAHVSCSSGTCGVGKLHKSAGKEEIDLLNKAMDYLEKVAQSMMTQKSQVSMAFVSDLVDALASVQSITDELVEMGYPQLPSGVKPNSVSYPDTVSAPQPVIPLNNPQPSSSPTSEISSLGDLGSITKPKLSENNFGKKKEIFAVIQNLIKRLSSFSDFVIEQGNENIKEPVMTIAKSTQDNSSQEKVAAAHPTDEIIEKQLDNAKFTGARVGEDRNVITEKQMESPSGAGVKDPNVTTSDSPQPRKDNSPTVIMEKQFNEITAGYVTRWNEWPEVITEKQWTDASRMLGSQLKQSQDNIITEKQLADFLSHHRYVDPSVITEKQLSEQKSDLARWAYSFDAIKTAKAVTNAMSDAIAFYHITPQQLAKVASQLNDTVENKSKASFLVAVNSLPNKSEFRKTEMNTNSYFSKVASIQTLNPIDAVITCLAENANEIKADDLVYSLGYLSQSKKAMDRAEKLAQDKLNKGFEITDIVDTKAALENAVIEMDRPDDGFYQVSATIDEIGANPDDKVAFIKAVYKFSNQQINDANIKTALLDVDLDNDGKAVVATLKDT